MLYLTRKLGETVVINDTIEVTVVEVRKGSVKLGFTFPPEASVLRKEIVDKIRQENLEAARARGELSGEPVDDRGPAGDDSAKPD
jgi:carbon storage regulator